MTDDETILCAVCSKPGRIVKAGQSLLVFGHRQTTRRFPTHRFAFPGSSSALDRPESRFEDSQGQSRTSDRARSVGARAIDAAPAGESVRGRALASDRTPNSLRST